MHIGVFQWLLQLAHPRTNDRTRPGAGGENKISDPDLVLEIGRAKRLPVLIRQLKRRDLTEHRNVTRCEPIDFRAPDKEKYRRYHQWNRQQSGFPGKCSSGRRS